MRYLGHLETHDPFYSYLRHDILPLLSAGTPVHIPEFRVFQLPASSHVYVYEERHTNIRIIGKFFGGVPGVSEATAFRRMETEFNNLNHLRRIGFSGYPHHVARPLGRNASLDYVLVEEFCCGTPLADFITGAIKKGERDALFQKLTALGYFLATLHNRTVVDCTVDFTRECGYFDHLMEQLGAGGRMGDGEARELHRLKECWREKACMWEDRQVLAHRDVTPANILFGEGLWVIVIDLERMKLADRAFDLGRVVGELQHYFMQQTGDKWLAEPYIGHFLWEYACHFPDRHSAFATITRRVPFYAAITLMRVARNAWINEKYSHRLLEEARKTLE
ncbi:MAG TPA: phosphotransferase [Nitrosospira sp.]|nr:phosphotransferase [Nitrosospira sp.]